MKTNKTEVIRRISLVFFLVTSTIILFLHTKTSYFPSVDFICPFGGLETIYKFLSSGSFLSDNNLIILFFPL